MLTLTDIFRQILSVFFTILGFTWWILIPAILFPLFVQAWLYYRRALYVKSLKWALLEVRIPGNIEKTPKAMEQVFASLHAPYSYGMLFKERYFQGKVEDWFSLELVGFSGGIYFFVRTLESNRTLVESAIYSQYPEAEIHEAEDYLGLIGSFLPNKVYDLWGSEFKLLRDDAYPIRTYPEFEEKTPEALIDPISTITEVMSKLNEGEMMFLQLMIRPTGDDWKKKAEALRDKLINRKKPGPKPGFIDFLLEFVRNLIVAPFTPPSWTIGGETKEEGPANQMLLLTPGERHIIESIERKVGKLGFETTPRFLYIDHRESFTRAHISAVMGAFRLFNTQDLNSLVPNRTVTTQVKTGLFRARRLYLRKRKLFDRFRDRRMPNQNSVLNIEELATIFHFPSIAVKAPLLRPLTAKKGEPPSTLPVE